MHMFSCGGNGAAIEHAALLGLILDTDAIQSSAFS